MENQMALCSLGWRPDVQDLRDFVLQNEHSVCHAQLPF